MTHSDILKAQQHKRVLYISNNNLVVVLYIIVMHCNIFIHNSLTYSITGIKGIVMYVCAFACTGGRPPKSRLCDNNRN